MHSRDRIAAAMVDVLKSGVPDLAGEIYPYGAADWGGRQRRHAVVTGGKAKISIEPGTGDRLERREAVFFVELADVVTDESDYVARIGDLAVAAERAMATLEDVVAVESVRLTDDTGVVELEVDEGGLNVTEILGYAITFFTPKGEPDRLVLP